MVLAIVFYAITKVARWRPQWLAIPAAVGVVWALAIGPATALRGLLAGPRPIVVYLGGVGGAPARVMPLGAPFARVGGRPPRQVPGALGPGGSRRGKWSAIGCGETGTPREVFAAGGQLNYEPLRGGAPGRGAAMVMGMIDGAGTADQYRRSCGAYLNDLFAVTDAAP